MRPRRAVLCAGALALIGGAVAAAWAVRDCDARLTLHVSGDWPGAIEIGAARAPLDEARVRAVLLTSWDKLRHIEGAAFLCGAPCEARPGPRVVRVVTLHAPRVTKDVLIRLPWDAVDGPAQVDLDCASGVVAAETTALLPDLPCWEAVTRWRLPFGLGVWG